MHVKKVASSTEIQLGTETRTVRDIIFLRYKNLTSLMGKGSRNLFCFCRSPCCEWDQEKIIRNSERTLPFYCKFTSKILFE